MQPFVSIPDGNRVKIALTIDLGGPMLDAEEPIFGG